MESSIKIDVSVNQEGTLDPVIRMELMTNVDDPRDRLLKVFFDNLGTKHRYVEAVPLGQKPLGGGFVSAATRTFILRRADNSALADALGTVSEMVVNKIEGMTRREQEEILFREIFAIGLKEYMGRREKDSRLCVS